jgi:hypothetical protein
MNNEVKLVFLESRTQKKEDKKEPEQRGRETNE